VNVFTPSTRLNPARAKVSSLYTVAACPFSVTLVGFPSKAPATVNVPLRVMLVCSQAKNGARTPRPSDPTDHLAEGHAPACPLPFPDARRCAACAVQTLSVLVNGPRGQASQPGRLGSARLNPARRRLVV